jgi:hypothetical protein
MIVVAQPSSTECWPTAARAENWRKFLVSIAAFAVTVLPLLLFLRREGLRAPLSMFAGDTFYYLTIARNSLHTHFFTFDGSYPTNGFHPVWEILLYLGMKFRLLRPEDNAVTLIRIYVMDTLILGIACALFAAFATRHLRRIELALLVVCPGFLWFGYAAARPVFLSNWSFVNGMESAVEMLFLAAGLLVLRTGRLRTEILSAILFGLMVLSRLDDVFILLPLLFFVWKHSGNKNTDQRLWIPVLPLGMIAVYLLYNVVTVHALLPTSGAIKAGYALKRNWPDIQMTLLPTKGSWVSMKDDQIMNFTERSYRVYQLVVPGFVCAAYLFRRKSAWSLTGVLCAGVVLKALYNLLFVAVFNQGFWYFGSSILIANLAIGVWIDESMPPPRVTRWLNIVTTYAVACLLISFSFNTQVFHYVRSGLADWTITVLQRRDVLRSLVLASGGDRFIELNDGVITYSTGMPALAGTGLALDVEATRALRTGHFLSLAASRNYHLILAAGGYRQTTDEYLKSRSHGFRGSLNQIKSEEFDRFKLTPVAHDDPTDVTIYRIEPIR